MEVSAELKLVDMGKQWKSQQMNLRAKEEQHTKQVGGRLKTAGITKRVRAGGLYGQRGK